MVIRSIHHLLVPFRLVALLAVLCANTVVHAQSSQALDEIMVLVNGEPITTTELNRRLRFQLDDLKRQKIDVQNVDAVKNQVLESAILDTVMLSLAKEEKLVPDDAFVLSVARSNAAKANMTLAQFKDRLAKENVSFEEYFADLKNEIAMSRIREQSVSERVKISDIEVDRFLRDPKTGFKQEYNLQHLTINKVVNGTEQALASQKAVIEALRQRAIKGESFDNLVKQFSNAADANAGGILGFKVLDKLPETYSLVAERMVTGDISDVFESSAGFHLVKVLSMRVETPMVKQTRVRHILIRVDDNTTEAQAKEEIKKIYDLLVLNKDRFAELAQKYGQDGTASKGGDLGWSLPGDMVPEFESVMDKLAIATLSEPVRTAFGWHVLEVLERESRPVTRERMRSQAKQILRQRKTEELTQEWLREIRARALVEFKKR